MSVARAVVSRVFMQGPRIYAAHLTPRLATFTTRVHRFAAAAEASDKNSQDAESKAAAANGKAAAETSTGDLNAKLKQLEELTAKNKELTTSVADFKDRYVRALAEMENVRTRLRKEVDNAKEFSISSFSKDVLDVADQLALALRNVPPQFHKKADDSGDEAAAAKDGAEPSALETQMRVLVEGVQMTHATLNKVLGKHGLTAYEVERGTQFDPARHQALYQVPTEDAKQHATIAECLKSGYLLRERVLRPAFVGVFKKA